MAVRLTQEHLHQMLTQAYNEAPNECCGLLLGKGEGVVEVFPGRNTHMSPKTYEMDPRDQLHAFQRMDERGWDLVAIYHSHPATEAYPSKTDQAKALYPEARYVIISLLELSLPKGWIARTPWVLRCWLMRMVWGPAYPRVRAFRIVDRMEGNGAPVKDREGNTVKAVTEEKLNVTRKWMTT